MIKTKAQILSSAELAIAQFLASGGSVTVVKARKIPKQKMRGKATNSSNKGTDGFAVGIYTKNVLVGVENNL